MNLTLLDNLLASFDASAMDVLIVFTGMVFAAYVIMTLRRLENRNKESVDKIWLAVNENKRKYAAINAWTYGASVAIRRISGITLIKQSANGEGDYTLDRDVD